MKCNVISKGKWSVLVQKTTKRIIPRFLLVLLHQLDTNLRSLDETISSKYQARLESLSMVCSAAPGKVGALELLECSWELSLGDIQGGLSRASPGNQPREHPQSHSQLTGH